jgi:hypothetical protein
MKIRSKFSQYAMQSTRKLIQASTKETFLGPKMLHNKKQSIFFPKTSQPKKKKKRKKLR